LDDKNGARFDEADVAGQGYTLEKLAHNRTAGRGQIRPPDLKRDINIVNRTDLVLTQTSFDFIRPTSFARLTRRSIMGTIRIAATGGECAGI
jgi:hypothetical protein